MKMLAWAVAAVLLVGIGVVATLGVQALTDDEPSRACEITSEWSDDFIAAAKAAPDDSFDDERWTATLERMDKLLDIRFKACHP